VGGGASSSFWAARCGCAPGLTSIWLAHTSTVRRHTRVSPHRRALPLVVGSFEPGNLLVGDRAPGRPRRAFAEVARVLAPAAIGCFSRPTRESGGAHQRLVPGGPKPGRAPLYARDEADTFSACATGPTRPNAIERLAREAGLRPTQVRLVGDPPTLAFNRCACLCWRRFSNSSRRRACASTSWETIRRGGKSRNPASWGRG